ncbi:MAG TPA: enoyl-CoA hydratase-related protein [Deltaproteobacteria bacterium]|jgi:enoyl-CoA hydratase/carnithine racemase|nr:enoyl-CoA hydratase-related protein [Deltaproteobacteria bacterium]HOI05663.1 enoyl-CoA hydratase-related protein [Deltaproteobacteria bacterium]
MADEQLLYTVENRVARITINREAQRNAVTPEAIGLFHGFLDAAEADADVRAVLVTGAGDKAFCTGAQLGDGMSEGGRTVFAEYARLLKRLATFPKPTVARVRGYCLAGGMGFMLACDIVVASDDSAFGTPEVNVGLWPMMIGALIFRNVPRKKAYEMIMLGERLTAAEALSMGLITRVVPAPELDGAVDAVLGSLTAKSPIGMKIGKEAFDRAEGMGLAEALDFLSAKLVEVASTRDAREGITAFLEKRTPVFTGE